MKKPLATIAIVLASAACGGVETESGSEPFPKQTVTTTSVALTTTAVPESSTSTVVTTAAPTTTVRPTNTLSETEAYEEECGTWVHEKWGISQSELEAITDSLDDAEALEEIADAVGGPERFWEMARDIAERCMVDPVEQEEALAGITFFEILSDEDRAECAWAVMFESAFDSVLQEDEDTSPIETLAAIYAAGC